MKKLFGFVIGMLLTITLLAQTDYCEYTESCDDMEFLIHTTGSDRMTFEETQLGATCICNFDKESVMGVLNPVDFNCEVTDDDAHTGSQSIVIYRNDDDETVTGYFRIRIRTSHWDEEDDEVCISFYVKGKSKETIGTGDKIKIKPSSENDSVYLDYNWSNSDWTYNLVDLSKVARDNGWSFSSNNMTIDIMETNDSSYDYDGFYIDDVKLFEMHPNTGKILDEMTVMMPDTMIVEFDSIVQRLNDNYIYSSCDYFHLYCLHNSTDALINLKNPGTYTSITSGAPTWTQFRGYKGSGYSPKYIRFNYIPYDDCTGSCDSISFGFGAYVLNNQLECKTITGGTDFSDYLQISGRCSGNYTYYRVNDDYNGTGFTLNTEGLWLAIRENTSRMLYQAGSLLDSSTYAATGLPTKEIYTLCKNENGTAGSYSSYEVAVDLGGFQWYDRSSVIDLENIIEDWLIYVGTLE